MNQQVSCSPGTKSPTYLWLPCLQTASHYFIYFNFCIFYSTFVFCSSCVWQLAITEKKWNEWNLRQRCHYIQSETARACSHACTEWENVIAQSMDASCHIILQGRLCHVLTLSHSQRGWAGMSRNAYVTWYWHPVRCSFKYQNIFSICIFFKYFMK